jgi:hypothetical protein
MSATDERLTTKSGRLTNSRFGTLWLSSIYQLDKVELYGYSSWVGKVDRRRQAHGVKHKLDYTHHQIRSNCHPPRETRGLLNCQVK